MLKKLPVLLVILLCFTMLFGVSAYAAETRESEQFKTATAVLSMNRSDEFAIRLNE